MINETRSIKYKALIHNINQEIHDTGFLGVGLREAHLGFYKSQVTTNTSLAMVFDYDKLNEYGKMIVVGSRLGKRYGYNGNKYGDRWSEDYPDINAFKDRLYKIEAAKAFVDYYENGPYKSHKEAYNFVFWAMMVLTVDKMDMAKHLSMICDFARLLKITDDEMEDMLVVIQIIYHKGESGFEFKTKKIPDMFSQVLALYNN